MFIIEHLLYSIGQFRLDLRKAEGGEVGTWSREPGVESMQRNDSNFNLSTLNLKH
ncbi:MAG: hypothetical protein AAGB30_16130 [Pedobacter sp.]